VTHTLAEDCLVVARQNVPRERRGVPAGLRDFRFRAGWRPARVLSPDTFEIEASRLSERDAFTLSLIGVSRAKFRIFRHGRIRAVLDCSSGCRVSTKEN